MTPQKRPLLVLLGAGAGLVLFALGFAFPLYLVIPIGLAALGMAFHPAVPFCASLLAAALLIAFRGFDAAVALMMFVPGGLLTPHLVRKKLPSLSAVFWSASATLLAAWIGMVFFADPINGAFAQSKANIIAWFAQFSDSALFSLYFDAEMMQSWRSMQLLMLEMARDALAGTTIAYSMLCALLSFLLCRKIAQKRGLAVAAFPKFEQWRLPAGFGLGAVILFMASFIAEASGEGSYASLAYALRVVVVLPFTVQGMSVLEYYLAKRKVHAAARVVINIALASFLSLVLTYCGVFEHAFALRQRMNLRTK